MVEWADVAQAVGFMLAGVAIGYRLGLLSLPKDNSDEN
jgi:biotin transporter BioY